MYICIYLHLLHHYVSHMPFVYYNYYVYNNNAVCLHGMCAPHRLPASHVQTVCIIYYTVRVCSNKLTVDVIVVIHIHTTWKYIGSFPVCCSDHILLLSILNTNGADSLQRWKCVVCKNIYTDEKWIWPEHIQRNTLFSCGMSPQTYRYL